MIYQGTMKYIVNPFSFQHSNLTLRQFEQNCKLTISLNLSFLISTSLSIETALPPTASTVFFR